MDYGSRGMHPGLPGKKKINILITGHRGYIGTVLVPVLAEAGYQDLAGLDSGLFRESALYPVPEIPVRETWKDIRDVEPGDLDGIDCIIHLAGLSNDPLGNLDPSLTMDINLHATVRLARLAREAGVKRFIFSSTCSVYGFSSGQALTEEATANPMTPYADSKFLAEQSLLELADQRFSPVILRSATAYGISPMLRFDLVVNNLVAWALATGFIHLKSDGTAWRPLVHVNDIARTMVRVVGASVDAVYKQVINVGSNGNNFRIIDIARMIENCIAGTRLRFDDHARKDNRNYHVSFTKLNAMFPDLGDAYPIEKAIHELCEHLAPMELDIEDFEGPRFCRIACIQSLLQRKLVDEELRFSRLSVSCAR